MQQKKINIILVSIAIAATALVSWFLLNSRERIQLGVTEKNSRIIKDSTESLLSDINKSETAVQEKAESLLSNVSESKSITQKKSESFSAVADKDVSFEQFQDIVSRQIHRESDKAVDSSIFESKYSDPREFIKIQWISGLPYKYVKRLIKPDSLPLLHKMLQEPQYSHNWTAIAAMICFISEDPYSVSEVVKYIQRPKELSYNGFDVVGKSKILRWVGLIKSKQANALLTKALTANGAQELAKDWIDSPEEYNMRKEEILGLIQGSAAIGLIHSQNTNSIRLVEQLYKEVHTYCKENRITTELYLQLCDTMAIRDLIAKIGIREYLNLQGAQHNELSPYIRKYAWHLAEKDKKDKKPKDD